MSDLDLYKPLILQFHIKFLGSCIVLLPTATHGFGLFEVSKRFLIQAGERLIHPLKGLDGPEHFPESWSFSDKISL